MHARTVFYSRSLHKILNSTISFSKLETMFCDFILRRNPHYTHDKWIKACKVRTGLQKYSFEIF